MTQKVKEEGGGEEQMDGKKMEKKANLRRKSRREMKKNVRKENEKEKGKKTVIALCHLQFL
jgi:hypothetical protein